MTNRYNVKREDFELLADFFFVLMEEYPDEKWSTEKLTELVDDGFRACEMAIEQLAEEGRKQKQFNKERRNENEMKKIRISQYCIQCGSPIEVDVIEPENRTANLRVVCSKCQARLNLCVNFYYPALPDGNLPLFRPFKVEWSVMSNNFKLQKKIVLLDGRKQNKQTTKS